MTFIIFLVANDYPTARRTTIGITLSGVTAASVIAYVTAEEQVSEPIEDVAQEEDHSGLISYVSPANDW